MKRNDTWTMEIDETARQIKCDISGNAYIVYADDNHIKAIYRNQFQNLRGGVDEAFELFGHPCRFEVWHEQPDIVWADDLVAAGTPDLAAKAHYHRAMRIGYYIQFAVFSSVVAGMLLVGIRGGRISSFFPALIAAAAFAAFACFQYTETQKRKVLIIG